MTAPAKRPVDPRVDFIPAAGPEREIRDVLADYCYFEGDDESDIVAMGGLDAAAVAVVEFLREKGIELW